MDRSKSIWCFLLSTNFIVIAVAACARSSTHLTFSYLMMHDESALAFDASKPDIDESAFQEVDWKDFYGEVEEELPPKMPEPSGRPVTISCFVDANHAGNVVTRRSHSGVLIFLMNAPIIGFPSDRILWSRAVLDRSSLLQGLRAI
jgi:hypothetical protein